MKWSKSFAALVLMSATAEATCPVLAGKGGIRSRVNPHTEEGRRLMAEIEQRRQRRLANNATTGDYGIPPGGFAAVRESIKEMLVDSKDFFPADFDPPIGPHYGGLMIRLAWHCSGSYRDSDGRGGCDGGRVRFDPELNWMDNANLNNALKVLEPIKEAYGPTLSWGDLITLAGTTAIEAMGGPVLGFCGGRVDALDGSESLILGPSELQEEFSPCETIGQQGFCQSPLGPTTVGLIYVNPEGPLNATGDPVASGLDVREAFRRMGFNDTETVAIVGGGHAFGKCHGACPTPPCGEEPMIGIGPNTYTSGFEGSWTTRPTTWTNEYFTNLFNLDWEIGTGPGGFLQWAPVNSSLPIIMLTTDIALAEDPIYRPISQEFATNMQSLEEQFSHAWYRLMSNDMGPAVRCINEDPDDIPPPQWWQYPLPEVDEEVEVDYIAARKKIQELIDADSDNIAAFSNLALRCASTYRDTDHRGGCNGARIRFAPENEWEVNAGTADALATLEVVKQAVPAISYADLIVLAGQTALETAADIELNFCGGRVDAMDGAGSQGLGPRIYTPPVWTIRDDMQVKGLTPEEGVALFAMPTTGDTAEVAVVRSFPVNALSNQYFVNLLAGEGDFDQYELALLQDEFLPIVQMYADDNAKFLEMFSAAWTKMMNADRFDGPFANICDSRSDATIEGSGGIVATGEVEVTTEPSSDSDDPTGVEGSAGVTSFSGAVIGLILAAVSAMTL